VSTECDRIADQLYRAIEGDAWHGHPVSSLLADVTSVMADARPIPGAHTIWELVLHLTVWADVARRRLVGEVLEPTDAEDWPSPADVTPDAWADARASLERAHADLRRAALSLGDGHLEDRTPGKPDTLYVMLCGIVQHAAYHGGQIAVLKRALPILANRPEVGSR